MNDFTSSYAGIALRNPIVVASSGQTQSVANIKKLVDAGAAAIILKSLFEEQIEGLTDKLAKEQDYPEALDYIQHYVKNEEIGKYINLIKEAKKEVQVPVIASINCFHKGDWCSFAKQIEEAQADAIEINIMRLETDVNANASQLLREYVEIVKSVASTVSIPVTVKIARTFSCPIAFIDKLRHAGAKGVTLFNRSYQMDIDIEHEKISSGSIFTSPTDIAETLRYTGLVAQAFPEFNVSASTGIHNAEAAIKALLVGAHSVQMCSAIYMNGPEVITRTLEGIDAWMTAKQYRAVNEFRGRLKADEEATLYNRMQFMKYFSNHKS